MIAIYLAEQAKDILAITLYSDDEIYTFLLINNSDRNTDLIVLGLISLHIGIRPRPYLFVPWRISVHLDARIIAS